MKRKHYNDTQRGFTLVEIMVSLTLLSLVSVSLTAFMIQSTRGLFWAANKSLITNDVRNFTMRISKETLGARTGIIYSSFALSDRNAVSDQKQSGETGDCLVLVYYDPYPSIEDPLHYTKLVIFFRKADADGISPVYRAEKVFSTPQKIDTTKGVSHFEDFVKLQFANDSGDYPVVLELSRGLADGKLFRNFGNNTFVVNGEILHGNSVKEVTNTYNLTISPRG